MAGLLGIAPEELALIGGLLSAKKGDNWGQHFMQLAAAQDAKKRREQQEMLMKQQMEQGALGMQQTRMQLEQARRQQGIQDQLRQAAGQAFAPPQEAHGPMESGQGAPMLPGGGGVPQFVQRAMQIDPMEGMKWQQSLAKQRNIKDVAPGASLYDVDNNKTLFTAPDKPKDWQDPAYQEFQMRKAAASRPQVNVDTRQETEFSKAMGKNYAENYQGILNAGFQSQAKMNSLNRFQNIVSKVPTGKLEPIKSEVAKVANAFGVKVDTEKLSYQEALDALGNEFALTLRNPQGGAGMPGALSDKDREFLVSMVPGLGKTPGGNMMIIEAAKRVAQREAEVARLARAYKAKTGRFDEGFYEVLAQEFGGKDILGDLHAKVAGMPQGGQVLRFDRNGNPL
jgi:hypothetical protein